MSFIHKGADVEAVVKFSKDGISKKLISEGNGSLDAVSNALKAYTEDDYKLYDYSEHSMQKEGSKSVAVAYIGLEFSDGSMSWGVGTHTDIVKASSYALVSAYNNKIRN